MGGNADIVILVMLVRVAHEGVLGDDDDDDDDFYYFWLCQKEDELQDVGFSMTETLHWMSNVREKTEFYVHIVCRPIDLFAVSRDDNKTTRKYRR
ncbi:hypothetical protein PoB_001999700 [Plakobranchus ocellatus]|uniref:Uncharacterized protein n=1 Tax=Plakobranchus ocellatus TaxID=259542 RepID=A0AAV3ZG85_9GAST|nr:hypothetical protein PoB_001999700 [Plakobranchus ocellatus]